MEIDFYLKKTRKIPSQNEEKYDILLQVQTIFFAAK